MKCVLEKQNKEQKQILNVGDIFITKKGNPHMVVYNNFNYNKLQVLKLSGERQSRIIKCFSNMNDLIANYDIAEVIQCRDVVINRR